MADLDSAQGVKQFALCKFDKPTDGLRIWNCALSESVRTKLVPESSSEHHLQFRCPASSEGGTDYAVYVELQRLQGRDVDWAVVTCTCPYASAGPMCKHGIAALLWRLPPETNPGPQNQVQAGNISGSAVDNDHEGSQSILSRTRLLPKSLRPPQEEGKASDE
jgi:hypothetical protein